jgi:hypothetical protein
MWVYSPHTGGKKIPPAVRVSSERRIREYAAKHYSAKFTRVDVRFHGALCHHDVYTEPDLPRGSAPPPGETRAQWLERLRNTPWHLCRIRFFGDEDRWSYAWYNYNGEKYQPGFLMTGQDHCTPEEVFEAAAEVF